MLEKYCLRDFIIMGEKDWHDCFTSATRNSRCNVFIYNAFAHFYQTSGHLNKVKEENN